MNKRLPVCFVSKYFLVGIRQKCCSIKLAKDLKSSPAWESQFDKFNIEVDLDADDTKEFKNFMENWEQETISVKLNTNEFRLLQKYKDRKFYDADEGDGTVMQIVHTNLEWKKKDKHNTATPCYVVIAKPAREGNEEDDAVEDGLSCYHINEELHAMIKDPRSDHPANIKLVAAPIPPV